MICAYINQSKCNQSMAEETKFQFDISYHQIMFLGPGLGYIKLSCWPKGSCWNPQTAQAATKTINCSLKNDTRAHC